MIFKNCKNTEFLKALFQEGEGELENYSVRYIPKKILRIKPKGARAVSHYDTYGFFQSSFLKAIAAWKIDTPEIITRMKYERDNFDNFSREDLTRYNSAELIKLVELMDKLDAQLISNKIYVTSYHGAGSIASNFLTSWETDKIIFKKLPEIVRLKRRKAYFGGRIELFKRGFYQNIHHYDINSAYPHAITELPKITDNWREIVKPSENDLRGLFGIANISWSDKGEQIAPFPFRLKSGYVIFPNKGAGDYHIVEVLQAIEKGYKVKINSAVVLEPPYEFPFKERVESIAKRRLELKKINPLLSYPLKLGLNSLYGKFAQRPTPSNKHPRYRELLYAGYITAQARAKLLKYVEDSETILFSTDGIYSLAELKCPISDKLGEFEYQFHDNSIFLLAGIYCNGQICQNFGELGNFYEIENKTRGWRNLSIENVYLKVKNLGEYSTKDRRFIGIKQSLAQPKAYKPANFYEIDRLINWENNAKRVFLDDNLSYPNSNLEGLRESYPYLDGKTQDLQEQIAVEIDTEN